jgi:hypothetical protein
MKTTVQVPVTTRELQEMVVEMPIYRKVDTKDLFMRVDMMGGVMREVGVKFGKNGSVVIKINPEYVFEDADVDYLLGQEEYTSDSSEFEGALDKVAQTIAYVSGK